MGEEGVFMKKYENGGIHQNTYEILLNNLEAPIPQSKEMANILRKMEEILNDFSLIEFGLKLRPYLFFEEEIKKDLSKNTSILMKKN